MAKAKDLLSTGYGGWLSFYKPGLVTPFDISRLSLLYCPLF